MKKYIALLRGINVGGKNKIPMPALKNVFEELGFAEVTTYINSGNVLFSSELSDKDILREKCEAAVTSTFGLAIPVVIIATTDLADTLQQTPSWWNSDKDSIHYAIFVIPPVSTADVFKAVGEAKPDYERLAHHGNVIFWSAPLKTFAKARWSKIASSAVNNHVTIRNANTVNKLLTLSQ